MTVTINLAAPDPIALTTLMSDLQRCFGQNSGRIATDLPPFLNALRENTSLNPAGIREARQCVPVAESLADLMVAVSKPLDAVAASAFLCDPWAAAALRRDEVRNASVLRWFLDPRGGHGCGDALLVNLLSRVNERLSGGFPERPSASCSVSVEECPDGDLASRVDIQADDPAFFLIIEVKIDATEQQSQVARYCDVAIARAAGVRPWAIVFLTIDGRDPTSAAHHAHSVVSLSWAHLAASLREAGRCAPAIPKFLAVSFATHISNL